MKFVGQFEPAAIEVTTPLTDSVALGVVALMFTDANTMIGFPVLFVYVTAAALDPVTSCHVCPTPSINPNLESSPAATRLGITSGADCIRIRRWAGSSFTQDFGAYAKRAQRRECNGVIFDRGIKAECLPGFISED